MNNRYLISIYLIIILLAGCKNNQGKTTDIIYLKDSVELQTEQVNENFDTFLSQFQQDSIFQKQRTIFPTKITSYNTDTEMYEESFINEDKWSFTNFTELPKKYIRELTKIDNNRYKYNLQIEDTGVSINYFFSLNKEKWYLVEIIDEST